MLKLAGKDSKPESTDASSSSPQATTSPDSSSLDEASSSPSPASPVVNGTSETKDEESSPSPEGQQAQKFLFEKMSRLLDKISTRVKTDPQLWEVYAEYYGSVEDLEKVCYTRILLLLLLVCISVQYAPFQRSFSHILQVQFRHSALNCLPNLP